MNKYAFFYFLLIISIIMRVSYVNAQPEINKTIKISDDLEIVRISDNSYIHISYLRSPEWGRVPCNGLIYINRDKAFIIDTPVSDEITLDLIIWLNNNLKVTVKGVIVNHWHIDCLGGLDQVHQFGIKSYGNKLTCEIAKSKNLPVPKISFKDSLTLKLKEKEIICRYFGAAHTVDNIVVWIPEEKILFGGCMVRDLSSETLGNTDDADLDSWPRTIEKVLNRFKDAKIVIPGHGNYGGTELLTHTLNLLQGNSNKLHE